MNDYSRPVLKTHDGDMAKKWHVYYRVFNPLTGKTETERDYAGLHKIKDKDLRYQAGLDKCEAIYKKLQSGWRPFQVVYTENLLQYQPAAKIYKEYLIANSVDAVASEYLKECSLSAFMQDEFRSKLRGFAGWLRSQKLHECQISMISNNVILRFFDFLISQQKLSGNTVKKYRHNLSALWDFAVKKKYATVNVVVNIPPCNRVNDESAKPVKDKDLIRLFKALEKDSQLELACKLELYCLMRPGKEVRLLRVGMIDFNRSVIVLPAEIVKNTNPNNRRGKVITVPDFLLQELKDKYKIHTYPEDYYVFGSQRVPGVEPLGKNSLRTRFRQIREALGLPEEYKLYSFKHTGVGALIDQSFHPNEIAQQAGWSNTYMLEVYAKHKEQRGNENIKNKLKPVVS